MKIAALRKGRANLTRIWAAAHAQRCVRKFQSYKDQVMARKILKLRQTYEGNKIFLPIIILLFFTSCLPLKQTHGDFNDQGVTLLAECNYVVLNINPANYPSPPVILPEESYAEHESGKRYPLIVNPTEILKYRNSKYVISDYLFLRAPGNLMTKYNSWEDGFWTLYLRLKCDQKIYNKHLSFELDTFYYNPIIHGVPN
ncbi:MAG: hypothetical protein WBM78_02370 [Desulfobacterales bacterium]